MRGTYELENLCVCAYVLHMHAGGADRLLVKLKANLGQCAEVLVY